jgi:hypothetical protein
VGKNDYCLSADRQSINNARIDFEPVQNFGEQFRAICTPIVYIKDQAVAQDNLSDEIAPTDPAYCVAASETVSQDFVKLVIPAAPPQRPGADGGPPRQPEPTMSSGAQQEERSAERPLGAKRRGERL